MKKPNLNIFKKIFKPKGERRPLSAQLKMALISTPVTLIIITCIVLLNIAAVAVTDRYPLSIDLTSEKVFELSQDSIDYITNLEKNVDIYVLASEADFSGNNEYYKQAYEVLKKYEQYSDKISLSFIDLASNPTFTNKFPNENLGAGDILVTSGDAAEDLTATDLFDIEYSYGSYGASITASKAEQALTSAILNVTSDTKPLITFVKGHNEADYSALVTLLEKNGFQTSEVSLLTEEISEDAQVVVFVAPQNDLSQAEIDKLQAFLKNESDYGKHFVYFASVNQAALQNLEDWLRTWGISVDSGTVVETDGSRVMSYNAYYGIADIVDTSLTGEFKDSDVPLIMPLTRPVSLAFSSSMGYSTSTLLEYSETAGIADENAASLSDISITGPITVAARSTYSSSSMSVFGSDYMIDQSVMESPSLSNESYILAAFNSLCPRKNSVSIPSKSLGNQNTFMLDQSKVTLYAMLFIIALPLGTLIIGLVIWLERKRQ